MTSNGSPAWHLEMGEYAAAAGGIATRTDGFFFVRHGETTYNKARIIQPKVGSQLNETGCEQARDAGRKLADTPFDSYYASDMERAWETATIMAEFCGRPIHPVPDLHERDWGDWAGQSNVDLHWAGSPEGGETLKQFTERTLRGLNEVLQHGEIAVVAHGGTFAVILAALDLPLRRPKKEGVRVLNNAAPFRVEPVDSDATMWRAEGV